MADGEVVGAGSLLNLLRDGVPRTRAELAAATGMARSTVAQRVDALVSRRLVGPVGEATSTGGRPPARFAFNRSAQIVLAADIGATHARIGVTDLGANVLTEHREDLDIALGPKAVLTWLVEQGTRLVAQAGRQLDDVAGVGVGLPGPVEHATGRPTNPPIMPGWDGFDVRGFLDHALSVAGSGPDGAAQRRVIAVDNDVNIMALGERFSSWPEVDHLVFVKVATGIGSGLISDGEIVRGAQGAAGDLGHISVPRDEDVVCRCGNIGCLEAIASGAAVATRLRALGIPAKTSQEVAARARGGSIETIQMIREAGRTIGEVLASVVSLLNPSLVVIGGSLAESGEYLVAGVREVVYRRSLPLATQHLRIVPSQAGEGAGVVGAAVMVMDRVLAPEEIDRYVRQAAPTARR